MKKTVLSAGLLVAAFSAYLAVIREGVRIPYYRSPDGAETRFIRLNFCFLLPCLVGRLVVDPESPGGRLFGKQYSYEGDWLDPRVIDFGPKDNPYRVPRIE
jgi:hypothetical protein